MHGLAERAAERASGVVSLSLSEEEEEDASAACGVSRGPGRDLVTP